RRARALMPLRLDADVLAQAQALSGDEVLLHRSQRERGRLREARDDRGYLVAEALVRETLRDEPDALRFGGIELAVQEHHLACPGGADDAGQQPWPRHVARDPDTEESRVEVRALCCVAKIAGGRPAEARTRARPVDGGHGDLR